VREAGLVFHQFVEVVDQENIRGGHVSRKHSVQTLERARDLHLVREAIRLHRLLDASAAHHPIPPWICKSKTKKLNFLLSQFKM